MGSNEADNCIRLDSDDDDDILLESSFRQDDRVVSVLVSRCAIMGANHLHPVSGQQISLCGVHDFPACCTYSEDGLAA